MFKNIFYKLLCLACFGFTQSNAPQDLTTGNEKSTEKNNNTQEDKIVAQVGNFKIYYSQVLKVLFAKLNGIQKAPDQKEMTKLYYQSREELIGLYSLYQKNKASLLKNKEFLKKLVLNVTLLTREHLATTKTTDISLDQVKAEYNELLKTVPAPTQYRLKVCVVDSSQKADRVLQAIEAGSSFAKIASTESMVKEFSDGNVVDPQTNSQFVTLFNNILPMQVKQALSRYTNPTKTAILLKTPVQVVNEQQKTTYWVIQIEQIKAGSKKDFPAFDEKMTPQITNVIANKMIAKEMEELSKQASIKRFKPDGTADAALPSE